jgi:Secretion system C-terminal sorting domain
MFWGVEFKNKFMKKIIVLVTLMLFINNTYSQTYWEEIDIPDEFNVNEIRTMYYDSVDNALWLGGNINHADSIQNIPYNFLLKYDGNIWTHFGPFYSFPIFDICRYQDKIVFCGAFQNYLGSYYNIIDQHRGIAYIQGDTVGHFDGMGAGLVFGLDVIDNELYALGQYDSICGIPAWSAAKFNSTQWSTVNDFPDVTEGGENSQVYRSVKYLDKIHLGGLYADYDYFGSSYNGDLSHYNGTEWQLTGGGIYGSYTGVSELKVFQDELYAAGIIYKLAGNAGNGIQKWNGSEWSSVGGDLKGSGNNLGSLLFVNDLEVHNDELYIAGVFEYAGDIEASDIVKWDGEKYCSFGGEFYGGLNGIAFMNDTMYVAGAFLTIDGIQTQQGMLAKYIGGNTVVECSTVGIKENDALLQLDIYPSPATNEINIYLPKGNYKNLEVEVYNLLGQKVQYKNSNSLESKKINIQIQNFSKGQYTVLLKEKGIAIAIGKFVKE